MHAWRSCVIVQRVTDIDADQLLSDAALTAAVGALASRNQHHLAQMSPQEQSDALAHWRELSRDVLAAARATLGEGVPAAAPQEGQPGRAVIVLEDAGEEDVAVHVAFHPELQDLGDGQLAGTPAQVTAVALLDSLGEGGGDEEGEEA
jgi:hypothetical protein